MSPLFRRVKVSEAVIYFFAGCEIILDLKEIKIVKYFPCRLQAHISCAMMCYIIAVHYQNQKVNSTRLLTTGFTSFHIIFLKKM